jgi:hypothetical protein
MLKVPPHFAQAWQRERSSGVAGGCAGLSFAYCEELAGVVTIPTKCLQYVVLENILAAHRLLRHGERFVTYLKTYYALEASMVASPLFYGQEHVEDVCLTKR